MQEQAFNDYLARLLAASDEGGTFSSDLFFSEWFNKEGHSYFFLFKKNLRVTNIQFAELLALIRTNINTHSSNNAVKNIQFLSVLEFNSVVSQLLNTFPHEPDSGINRYQKAAECYGSILKYTIVIDMFFGSCAVYVPPHFDINIARICALSGYIHSCGHNIFINRVDKVIKDDFFDVIDRYLLSSAPTDKPVFFSVYAHEDFTKFDRRLAPNLSDGLDDVKIYVEKFYMGQVSLVAALKEMQDRFQGRLQIPEPGDYHKKHKEFRQQQTVDTTRTIWLIVDHSVSNEPSQKGKERFYICYDQRFINENPFHIFDENKPAWIAHNTIPHTLAAAMINITAPMWPIEGDVSLADPFSGTGTTWLESLKYERLKVESSDIEVIAPLLAADNAAFFSSQSEELNDLCEKLDRSIKEILSPNFVDDPSNNVVQDYNYAIKFVEKIKSTSEGISFFFSIDEVAELEKRTKFERLLVYLTLRTALRHLAAFDRESEDWHTAFLKESNILSSQIKDLIKLRIDEKNSLKQNGAISIFAGSYSESCSLNPDTLIPWQDVGQVKSIYKVRDARDLPPNSFDIIISDPPYGFNVEHEVIELAILYAEVIKTMILAVRNNGQLVLCLPEKSYNGRPLPLFTDKRIITQQILTMAEECEREIVILAGALPPPTYILRPPYYWESERALRRSILHFRISHCCK